MDLNLTYTVIRVSVNMAYLLTNDNDDPSRHSRVCVSKEILSSHCGGR